MNLFASNFDKAKAALADSRSALAVAVGALDAHRLVPADPGDAAAQKQWLATERDLAEDVRIAEGVVAHWTGVVERLEAEAAEKGLAERATAMARRQAASAKRVCALSDKFIAPLIAELEWLVAEEGAFAGYNATRGAHPFLDDPEQVVRQRPGRTEPAVYEDRTVWRDAQGNAPTVLITDHETGEMRPQEAGFIKRTERVCVRAERAIVPSMPDRLAELLPALRKALRA